MAATQCWGIGDVWVTYSLVEPDKSVDALVEDAAASLLVHVVQAVAGQRCYDAHTVLGEEGHQVLLAWF